MINDIHPFPNPILRADFCEASAGFESIESGLDLPKGETGCNQVDDKTEL